MNDVDGVGRGAVVGIVAARQLAAPGALGRSGDRLAAAAGAVLGGALLGACIAISPQLGCAVAVVLVVLLLFVASPSAGLLALWAVWLLTPGLRRVLGLVEPSVTADPLSAAPFVATAALAAVQIARARLEPDTGRVLLLALAGLAVGVPAGAVAGPSAMLYGLVAYGGAVLAFVLGRSEAAGSMHDVSLHRALAVAVPALALYAIAQYFLPLAAWDSHWLASVDFTSIGAPEEGHIRVFSTLNAPGTLAAVLGVSLLCALAADRPGVWTLAGAALAAAALALTYVRGAWIALAVAAIVIALLGRTRASRLMFGAGVVLVGAALVVGPATPTTAAFAERLQTFGTLETDTSATERVATPLQLLPEALTRPLGHGLGSAGEATRLGPESELVAPDNGYLSLLYQLGPAGVLLVLAAAAIPLSAIARHVIAGGARDPESILLLATGVFLLVLLFTGDIFYGVTGVVFWFLLGRALTVSQAVRP